MMTSTTCAAGAGASAAPPLVTALADALDDLGLKRLVVGQNPGQNTEKEEEEQEEQEQAYHQSVWRAYRDDRGGMSLTVARKLLGMALTAREMKEILENGAAVGRGGIMTWGDIEAVCREMGCPTCCCAGAGTGTSGTNVEQEDKDDNDGDNNDDGDGNCNDAKAHRKVELTLFLATEVECRRLSRIGSGGKMVSSPSPPSAKTSPDPSAAPNTNLLQKLVEISPPGQEISEDQLRSVLQQSASATSDQIDRILECNRALQADYSLRKKMMMQKFDATAIAMARSRKQAKKKEDSSKDAPKSNEETGAQDDIEEEAAMDPVEVEIREIAASIANMDISSSSDTKAVDTSSGDVIVQQFLLPSTRFGSETQMQIMKGDVDTYDRGGRIDQDDRNSMPAWQNKRQEGTPPRTPAGGKSPAAGRSKKKKTPKKQSTPKKEEEEAKDGIPGSDAKIVEDMTKVVEEPKDASSGPSSTRKSSRRRRGKGKNKGNTDATPGTISKQEKVQDAASSETNTPVKPSKLDFEDAKDGFETPAADTTSSSARKRSSKRRRPKKSGEATPNTGDKQKSATGGDSKGGDDKKSKLETPASKEGQGDGKNKNSRRRHRGRGKPSQKPTEALEGK